MNKWLVVAKNEYRMGLSGFRAIRRFFPYLMLAFFVVYIAYLAPAFVGLFVDEVIARMLSQAAVALLQVMLFMAFFFFLTFPISMALKEVKPEQQEIFLSAPVKPSDVLLGKYLGQIPFYAIGIALIIGLFLAILKPLGINFLQIVVSLIICIVTLLSAIWIGVVATAILRTKLGRTARGRDIGKALSFVVVLPVVALMYAMMGGGLLKAIADPERAGVIKAILNLLPSSWGTKVIAGYASNPGNIVAGGFETLARFAGVILFFIAALWLGTYLAKHAYSLETVSFSASSAKLDGVFYKTIRNIGGGGSFGTLLASIFKDYSRRFQNISKIIYIICILVLVNIFFTEAKTPRDALLMAQFMLPIVAVFVVGEVTLRGKEALFIFRRAPFGENKVVKARLIHGLMVVVPIAILMAIGSLHRVPETSFATVLAYTGLTTIVAAAYVVFALGLFLLMPAYSEKSAELVLNIMILAHASIIIFIGSTMILKAFNIKGFTYAQFMHIVLSWLFALLFFSLGKSKLKRLE
ncbi:MAG: hypothetical protein JSV96_04610 [Candidatus Aminicenantes bacterium]|nr:MAG: hypothetical protein JSV96_04610 [Candidatus Aminicenantes bacterium]